MQISIVFNNQLAVIIIGAVPSFNFKLVGGVVAFVYPPYLAVALCAFCQAAYCYGSFVIEAGTRVKLEVTREGQAAKVIEVRGIAIARCAGDVCTVNSTLVVNNSVLIGLEIFRQVQSAAVKYNTATCLLIQHAEVIIQCGIIGHIYLKVVNVADHVEIQSRAWQYVNLSLIDTLGII